MEITRAQAGLLINKLYNLAQPNTFTEDRFGVNGKCSVEMDSGKIKKITYNSKDLKLCMREWSSYLEIMIHNSHGKYDFNIDINTPTFFFSTSNFKWWAIKRRAMKFMNKKRKEHKQRLKERAQVEFNKAFCESFQDEVNDILLENNND